jgi:hypothetical protein
MKGLHVDHEPEPNILCAGRGCIKHNRYPRLFGDLFSYAKDGKALAAIAGESERA